jgi:hypothetical protein
LAFEEIFLMLDPALSSLSSAPPNLPARQIEKPLAVEYNGDNRVDYVAKDSTIISSKEKDDDHARGIKDKVHSLLFPQGYPDSVSPEYGNYRKWTEVQNCLNSAIDYFGTQAALTALGVAFPVPAVAALAWMIKDSTSGLGKFLGSYMAHKVDQDPKTWNVIADSVTAAGKAMNSTLALAPKAFLPLAIGSNIVKASGETLSGAAQANFDKHLASNDNLGEMNAKNNNQDMLVSGIGVGLAVGLQALASMTGIGAVGLVAIYAGLNAVSLIGSYRASKAINWNHPNEKNMLRLFESHSETGKVMTPKELEDSQKFTNRVKDAVLKRVVIGAGLKDLSKHPETFKEIVSIFNDKNYLIYRDGKKTKIALRPEADRKTVAEAMYCAALLEKNLNSSSFALMKEQLGDEKAVTSAITQSLKAMPKDDAYYTDLGKSGWEIEKIPLPAGTRVEWGDSAKEAEEAPNKGSGH